MPERLETTIQHNPAADEDIKLIDVLIVLAKHKVRIAACAFGGAVVVAGVSLMMPNIFTAATKIMPPQQAQSSAAAMLGQLGALGGLAGSSLGIKTATDTYLGMLSSRTIGDRLAARFALQKVYGTKFQSDTLKVLAAASSFTAGKDGMIEVQVDDVDPKRASMLANAYVEELQKLMLTLAVTDASQRRLFFEKQLLQAKQNLAEAEVALKRMQEKSGLIRLEGQAEVIISSAARLKGQIAAKEVEMGALRTFATSSNPEIIRIEQELSGLRAQLAKVETGLSQGRGDISLSTSQVPEAGLEFVRRVRDVKYNEAIFDVLAKQFEIAKIDEAKDSSTIQVLDQAIEPDRKSKPKRAVMVILGALACAFLATCWAFFKEWADGVKSPSRSDEYARLALLRRHLRWRKTTG